MHLLFHNRQHRRSETFILLDLTLVFIYTTPEVLCNPHISKSQSLCSLSFLKWWASVLHFHRVTSSGFERVFVRFCQHLIQWVEEDWKMLSKKKLEASIKPCFDMQRIKNLEKKKTQAILKLHEDCWLDIWDFESVCSFPVFSCCLEELLSVWKKGCRLLLSYHRQSLNTKTTFQKVGFTL